MTTYYISGGMRGKKDYNRDMFNAVETALVKWCYDKEPQDGSDKIINPSKNFGGRVDLSVSDYMKLDLQQVLEADIIVQLPEWQTSEGAVREAQLGIWADKRFLSAYPVSNTEGHVSHWAFKEIDAPEFSTSPRASVCDEGKQLITGDRNNAYGPPTQDFRRTAAMANGFGFQVNGHPMQSHHVAIFMELLKISRLAWTPTKRDSWVDTIGYAGCGYECAVTEEAERLAQTDRMKDLNDLHSYIADNYGDAAK